MFPHLICSFFNLLLSKLLIILILLFLSRFANMFNEPLMDIERFKKEMKTLNSGTVLWYVHSFVSFQKLIIILFVFVFLLQSLNLTNIKTPAGWNNYFLIPLQKIIHSTGSHGVTINPSLAMNRKPSVTVL